MSELEELKKALEREQQARKAAEELVEQKVAELHASNQKLLRLNKQLEQEVHSRIEESEILARLPEEIPDPVMRISRFGIITYTNSAYKQHWGPYLAMEEGSPYPAIFEEAIDKAILESNSHIAEFDLGGRNWSVQFSAVEQYGYINILARDISAQKQAQESIHKSQAALLEAQELGNLGRWEFNLKDNTFSWSPQLYRQLGIDLAEKEPDGGDFFKFVHPDDLFNTQLGLTQAMDTGYAQFEQRIIRADGSLRHLYTTVKTETVKGVPNRIVGTSLDVTELRLTEKQLRESEERFQLALQGMNDGIWDWDMVSGSVYLSPQWKSLIGFEDDELENTFDNFTRFVDPADSKNLEQLFINSPAVPKHKLSYEFRIKHRNGNWRHMMCRCVMLRNEQGELVRMVGAITDLTQRIEAERKLLTSMDQMKILSRISFMFNSVAEDFEQPIQEAIGIIGKHSGVSRVYVFENSSDGVFASNTFEWCKPGVAPLIETLQNVPYSALQTFQRTLKKQGIVASDLSSIAPVVQSLLSKKGVKSLMIMPFYVQDELRGFVGFDDCAQHRQWESADVELLRTFANLIGNIFERQQAEYKVLQSEERYRSLVDNLTEVIFQTDSQSEISFLNPAWQEITGYSPDESLGMSLTSYLLPEDQNEFRALQVLLFEHKIDFCRQVMRIRIKDGSIRYVEVFARLIEGKWGQAEGLSGTLTDVTEQQIIKDKLIKAKELAEKASMAKAQFLSVMSHEIRTPLNAMLGISHLLIRQQPRPDQEENLRMLKFSGENLLSLINDILDFNKIESGKITIEKASFDLRKLCHSLQKSLSLKADEKGVALDLNIDEEVPASIIGDSTRLTQILNNLLDNAVKFTHQGKVALSINLLKKAGNSAVLRFRVSDTGIGIHPESLSSIFEAFTQVHERNKQQYGGTGLGLAIIKRLLDLLESKIEVESSPGKGSTFSFDLAFDLADEKLPALPQQTEKTAPRQDLQKASVLLVEDNPLNMLVLVQFFEIWGIHPDVAENGLQAVSKIKENNYDVVLMDLHMPEMDGIEATQYVREELGLTDLPIIALTANALPGIRQKVVEAGMNDYVSKPFEPEDLFQTVMKYISQAKNTCADEVTPAKTAPAAASADIVKASGQLYSLHKLYQQSNNNPAFVERMVNLFVKTCSDQLITLHDCLEQGEAASLREVAHRLKPSIDLFDIRCQKQSVRKLEQIELSEMQTPDGWKSVENFISCLQTVIEQLQAWLSEQNTITAK
ncbi:PAS domain S-box protein [Cesiribacter sp. SM1]|uniref:PAS domain S-box protein n=1 Tax=Cesiribacter sp. SM1 TaxID=2861196 RepID=UPI001CD3740C|nr:PAS domain S-box protein [Cesiribacter sp. SM1]